MHAAYMALQARLEEAVCSGLAAWASLTMAVCARMQLNLVPGRKGLRSTLGDVPSWVAFQDKEKVEVRRTARAPCRAPCALSMSPPHLSMTLAPCVHLAHMRGIGEELCSLPSRSDHCMARLTALEVQWQAGACAGADAFLIGRA